MKRIGLLIIAVVFTTSLAAQEVSSVEDVDVVEEVATEVVEEQATVTNEQIVDALKKDEDLQKKALNYLKENPDTADAVATMVEENGGWDGIINTVLRDPQMTAIAVEYVKNNPEMLSKVASLVSM